MDTQELIHLFGPPIEDAEEAGCTCKPVSLFAFTHAETFVLFSETASSGNLGFIDPRADTIDVCVAGRDFQVTQSPAVLGSTRAGGTTGAVVWRITPALGAWLADSKCPLGGLLKRHTPNSSTGSSYSSGSPHDDRGTYVLELGCGVAGILALALGDRVERYVLSDQEYVRKLLHANIQANAPRGAWDDGSNEKAKDAPDERGKTSGISSGGKHRARDKVVNQNHLSSMRHSTGTSASQAGYIAFKPLDWEVMTPSAELTGRDGVGSFDLVVGCDCVYNEALVGPFVETCEDVCRLRLQDWELERKPTVCLVAQQLRDPTVFEAWIAEFHRSFETWRVPNEMLPVDLQSTNGLVIHIGILRT
ncbi:Ribosomal protein lysine methyltransferase [Ceratocystis pirilliformis]|uniref:Ribosomal protein lysine methyltransferase n=1 Tax=Ceratocystis pirilliformis TaxID=259994 RepID=A0ABR3Z903_9PEZI